MKRLIAIALAATTSASAAPALDDVRVAGRTKAGDPVFAIGTPTFVVGAGAASFRIALRAGKGVLVAEDDQWVSLWDATTGVRQRHIPAPHEHDPLLPTHFAISPDGGMLAIGLARATRLFPWPFTTPAGDLDCSAPLVFSHDGGKLLCGITDKSIWDVRGHRKLADVPERVPYQHYEAIAFTADDQALVFATDRTVERWTIGADDTAILFRAPHDIEAVTAAASGAAIGVSWKGAKGFTIVATATGTTTIVPAQDAQLSPSGALLADSRDTELVVTDVATKKRVWHAAVPNAIGLEWAEDDRAFVWLEDRRLHVEVLPNPPPALPEPLAFGGWRGPGLAAIGDAVLALPVGAFDASLAAPSAEPPGWATWVAPAPDNYTVAAAPSERHDAEPDVRGQEPCDAKLRVWTARGGVHALTMACSTDKDHPDPGWELGGGWAAAIGWRAVTVWDAVTGKRAGTIPARGPATPAVLATEWWLGAFAATNDLLVLVSRTPVQTAVDPDASDARGTAEGCLDTGGGECERDYDLEVWRVKGKPAHVVRIPLEHYKADRKVPTPMPTALAVDPTGAYAVVGLDSGVVRVIPLAAPSASRAERLHESRIVALSIDPSGTWVYSRDLAGEARVWPLAPLAGPRGSPPG